jgi:PIF1-like helicase
MEVKPHREHVTVEDAVAKRDNLKDDQRWIYDVIMEAIEGQQGQPAQNGQAICEFTTGGGGTGKSDLIRALHAALTCKFESKRSVCVLSAPTGIAAKNIRGFTIHSILSFEVQQGGIGQYLPLVDRKRSTISSNMKDVRLLVLDECSMFSNVMLLKLHRRLCEIGDSNFCMRLPTLCSRFGLYSFSFRVWRLQLTSCRRPTSASPSYGLSHLPDGIIELAETHLLYCSTGNQSVAFVQLLVRAACTDTTAITK